MKKTVVRYGDPGSHKIMADLITTHGQRFPSGHILCSLSGCDGWVRHKSKYCIKHMERMKRNGHPTAKPIRFNRNETHMRYVKAGLWVVQRTPGGKEEIQRVLEFIKKKLDESYTKLPKNPYDSRGWTKEEAIAVFYCNLAEHGVTPEKILTRVASVLFGHDQGLINIHTEKHLRYTLTSAILSSAPRPLMWSLKYKAWGHTRRVPMVVKEYLGDWALYQLGTIESLCIRNRSRVMDRFKILQGLKGRKMGPPVKGWKKFKRGDRKSTV